MSPSPERQPMWTCGDCGAQNESFRARCRNCQTGTSGQITPFYFPATGQSVRTVLVDGEPWIFAGDVCAALDIANVGNALARLDDDEKGSIRLADGTSGNPNRAIVNEAGFYSLVLRSDKPEAKTFRRWVTHDVIPTIRRTGSYAVASQRELTRKELARYWYEAEERAEAAEQRAAELEGPAHSWHVLASGAGDYSVGDAAKILSRDPAISIGRDRLFTELADAGWIYRARGDRRWRAYQAQVDTGRLSELPQHYENKETGQVALAAPQVRVTVKGIRELHRQLGGIAPLQLDLTEGGA